MKFLLLFLIAIYTTFVLAENHKYIISIERNKNDINYDDASKRIQYAIDELVNDRMNDIYNIISDKEDTYILENGQQDENLKELEEFKMRKRSGGHKKFRFINRNRPENQKELHKRSSEEEILFESNLVSHICPVLNYYTIVAYLSDEVAKEVKKLPNIIAIEQSHSLENLSAKDRYYNLRKIKKETQWSNVEIQSPGNLDDEISNVHLSLISQGKYKKQKGVTYDNNYYYPSSAGKGIDIYFIDEGISTNNNDFDTYNGGRTISCDVIISGGKQYKVKDKKECYMYEIFDVEDYPEHGIMVSSIAAGKLYGVAKKANVHMIASGFVFEDFLSSLDYIRRYATPHKTIINISRGGYAEYSNALQNKINELTKKGFIIVAAVNNDSADSCKRSLERGKPHRYFFSGYNNVIRVGAINGAFEKKEELYYDEAHYSNYGKCVDIYAPGFVGSADSSFGGSHWVENYGTSCAAPIVSGVIATIMSEHPKIKYNYTTMKNELIKRSLKGAIKPIHADINNRLVNNGKASVYKPFRCDDPSGKYKCTDGCCSREGLCISPDDTELLDRCLVEHGCQSNYGKCLSLSLETPAFTFRQKRDIVISTCYKELATFKECEFSPLNVDGYQAYSNQAYLDRYCDIYRRKECKKFYEFPIQSLPSCQTAANRFNFDFSKLLQRENNAYYSSINNFICSLKKDGSRCFLPDMLIENNISVLDEVFLREDDKRNCEDNECRKTFLNFTTYLYKYKNTYFYKNQDLRERINFLSSNECVASARATTTKVTLPTFKPLVPCGKVNGPCAKPGECCSKKGFCGTTEEHCGVGCQTEFGSCYILPEKVSPTPSPTPAVNNKKKTTTTQPPKPSKPTTTQPPKPSKPTTTQPPKPSKPTPTTPSKNNTNNNQNNNNKKKVTTQPQKPSKPTTTTPVNKNNNNQNNNNKKANVPAKQTTTPNKNNSNNNNNKNKNNNKNNKNNNNNKNKNNNNNNNKKKTTTQPPKPIKKTTTTTTINKINNKKKTTTQPPKQNKNNNNKNNNNNNNKKTTSTNTINKTSNKNNTPNNNPNNKNKKNPEPSKQNNTKTNNKKNNTSNNNKTNNNNKNNTSNNKTNNNKTNNNKNNKNNNKKQFNKSPTPAKVVKKIVITTKKPNNNNNNKNNKSQKQTQTQPQSQKQQLKSNDNQKTLNKRCGPNIGSCKNSCCSKYGYCGTTKPYCGKGCQKLYGICL